MELFAITARRVWLHRNDVVHGGSLTHPSHIMLEASKALEDYQRVNGALPNKGRLLNVAEEERWKPPRLT